MFEIGLSEAFETFAEDVVTGRYQDVRESGRTMVQRLMKTTLQDHTTFHPEDIAKEMRQIFNVAQSEAFEACNEEDVKGTMEDIRERPRIKVLFLLPLHSLKILHKRVIHLQCCHDWWFCQH